VAFSWLWGMAWSTCEGATLLPDRNIGRCALYVVKLSSGLVPQSVGGFTCGDKVLWWVAVLSRELAFYLLPYLLS